MADMTGGSTQAASTTPVTPTTPDVKMVRESDLMAVKESAKSWEDKAKAAETELLSAKASSEQHRQEVLKRDVTIEELNKRFTSLTANDEAVKKANTDRETALKSVEDWKGKVLATKVNMISTVWGIKPESLTGKSLEQVDLFEEALKAIGKPAGNQSYANGGTGAAGGMTQMDIAAQQIAAAKALRQS
jgi:hypothetical protein